MGKLNRASVQFIVLASAFALAACNGSSVTNRTANPTKPYQNAIDRSQPWRPGMKRPEQPKDADNRQFYCGNDVFRLVVNGDPNLRRAEFHADVESTVELKIDTQVTSNYKVTKIGGPKALSLRSLGDPSRWQLVWKPTRDDLKQDSVKIAISDEQMRQTCQFSYADVINLVVDPGPDAPVLTIGADLPKEPVEFTDTPLKFGITIVDPAGSADKAPVISEVGADDRAISNPEARQLNVSAKGAVTCDNGTLSNPAARTWTFACEFRMNQLPDVAGLAKTAQVINAIFFVKGKSLASTLDAPQASAAVQVHFAGLPKDDTTKATTETATTGAPAASTDKAAKPAVKPAKKTSNKTSTKSKQRGATA